jgi:hypothetical protein
MMNPAFSAPWTLARSARSPAHAQLAALDRAALQQLEAVLFEGASCVQLARSSGAPVTEIRRRIAAALLALCDAPEPAPARGGEHRGGAIETMLALRALDALDPDEAALVDLLLAQQPALQRALDEYLERVGDLCATVPHATPSTDVLDRLRAAVGDDDAMN